MKKVKAKKEKPDFDRIIWSDELLDKILSGFAVFMLSTIIIFIIIMFSSL